MTLSACVENQGSHLLARLNTVKRFPPTHCRNPAEDLAALLNACHPPRDNTPITTDTCEMKALHISQRPLTGLSLYSLLSLWLSAPRSHAHELHTGSLRQREGGAKNAHCPAAPTPAPTTPDQTCVDAVYAAPLRMPRRRARARKHTPSGTGRVTIDDL